MAGELGCEDVIQGGIFGYIRIDSISALWAERIGWT
mgnify:CR=1 FL=1